jgi:hypothetical protein
MSEPLNGLSALVSGLWATSDRTSGGVENTGWIEFAFQHSRNLSRTRWWAPDVHVFFDLSAGPQDNHVPDINLRTKGVNRRNDRSVVSIESNQPCTDRSPGEDRSVTPMAAETFEHPDHSGQLRR